MSIEPGLAVTMDWGGTWIRVATVNSAGQIIWQDRHPNPRNATQPQLVAVAKTMLDMAIVQSRGRTHGVGIAVAGPVDTATGTLHEPPNLRPLDGVSFKSLWEDTLGCPVYVGNDASLAALGEFYYGAGQEARGQGATPRTLIYVTVSTGIGGGIVDRGQMFVGAGGLAGEVGHMTIDYTPSAPPCLCGNRGCLEALASGPAIARIARERLGTSSGRASTLSNLAPSNITSETVFRAASAGDAMCREIVEEIVHALGVSLANVLHLYNPDMVVLGGGVTVGLQNLNLIEKIRAIIDARAMSLRHKDYVLSASSLGDSVGLIGAAAMVQQRLDSLGNST